MMSKVAGQKFIRIKFSDDETGWAEQLTPDTAKIMNIPVFSDEWLLFDVVELTSEDNDGWRKPKRLLERRFHGKTAFYYESARILQRAAKALKKVGCQVEGLLRPRGGEPGVVAIVYPKGCDVTRLASKIGLYR